MNLEYPLQFDRQGRTASTPDASHVRGMIEQLLFTLPGERVNRPTFGTDVMQLVFAPNSQELATAVQFLVQGSLQQWLGDRITIESVDVTSDDATLEVVVVYRLRGSQERRVDRFTRAV